MAAAVFRVKFTIPVPSPHYLARPRLDRHWDRGRRRLVTVTAGAGWGKTDFLAARAREVDGPVLWYGLDELDRDPAVLVAHLAAACGLPESSSPPLEQLAAIVGRLDDYALLILDDVHAIAHAERARVVLARLLRYLPPGCALSLASREPIDLAAARLEVRGEAAHLTATDLALAPAETRTILDARLGARAAARIAPRVQALSEGWPTGLEICCQALAESRPERYGEVLTRLEAGEGRWFELFSSEVLADLEPALREFLLRTSVLSHLDPDLCDRLLVRRDSGRRLRQLAARGLFITPIGDNAWRLHNLMRSCLRRHLDQELAPTARRQLGRRAAALLAAQGEPEAAALDLIQADDTIGAAKLLRKHARELADTRRPEAMALILANLPEGIIRDSTHLLLVRAGLAQLRGDWDAAEADLRRTIRRGKPARIVGAARTRLVRLHLQRGQFARCLANGRRTLAHGTRPVGADRGLVLASMGVAAASLGRLDQGEAYLHQARVLAQKNGDQDLAGRCHFLAAANIHYVRGELDLAVEKARLARDLYRELGRSDLACHTEGVLGFVLAGRGRPGEARESTLAALQHAEAIGYRLIAGYARLTLGMCDLLTTDPAAAVQHFGEALGLARDLGEHALETWARLGLAESAWRREDFQRARNEAASALELATQQRELFSQARAHAQLGRLAEHTKRGTGRPAWAKAERIFRRLGAELERDRLRLWRAAAGLVEPAPVIAAIEGAGRGYLLDRLEAPLAATLRAPTVAATRVAPASDAEPLHVRLLGPLEIDRGPVSVAVGSWRSRRARRLFQLLVLNRTRTVGKESAMEAMWPEADPRKATVNLRQSVFQLRRVLEVPGCDSPRHVLVEGEALRLDLGAEGTCDLEGFEAALSAAQRHRREGKQDAELGRLRDAVAFWRGPVLADSPYDPEVDEAGSTLRYRYLRAVDRLLDLMAARGHWEDVVDLARQSMTEDPLREALAHHLLRGLLELGHRQEAFAAYARFENRMVAELDLLPSERLKEILEGAGSV